MEWMDGLQEKSIKLHNIQPVKVTTEELEVEILKIFVTKRFGCIYIKFELKCLKDITIKTRIKYKILKRQILNIMEWKETGKGLYYKKNQPRTYRWTYWNHFILKLVLRTIMLSSIVRRSIVNQEKERVNRQRKRNVDLLDVIELYIIEKGKPEKVLCGWE